MWLCLCEAHDAPARWACEGLAARGLKPLERISAEVLAYARWEHRVGVDGASVEVTLPDGRTLRADQVRGTLNRLLFPPQESLLLIQPDDRAYVIQEMTAFFMSWLAALPGPMLNPASSQSLCGRLRHISEWLWLAGRAGLRTPVYRHSSYQPIEEVAVQARVDPGRQPGATMIVVGERVTGPAAPPDVVEGCLRLARLAASPLLGVEFVTGQGGEWDFLGATIWPDLRLGGEAFLDGLAEALVSGEEVAR